MSLSHKAVIVLIDNAALLYQVGINIHLANVVDDNCKLDSFLVCEDTVYQCCLSAAQITGEQQYRYILHYLSFIIGYLYLWGLTEGKITKNFNTMTI